MSSSVQSQLPITQTVLDDGDPIEGENIVEFRLLYKGKLEKGGSPSRVHPIRAALHPQIKELWSQHKSLDGLARRHGLIAQNPPGDWESAFDLGIQHFVEEHNGRRFVPLVREPYFLKCSLDILFLRRESPGSVFMRGDIDGRLKTLFDALRIPKPKQEQEGMGSVEDPFYVLLDDDSLITEVKVTTDRLLMLPDEVYDSNQVFLVINVKLQPYHPSSMSSVFA